MSVRSSPNTEQVYAFEKPGTRQSLPSTARREADGLEILRVPQIPSELFGRESRHFGLVIRATSASTICLDQGLTEKLVAALSCSCDGDDIALVNGIPVPSAERVFRVTRPIDLFQGGERDTLEAGLYRAGSPIVDGGTNGRLFLEMTPINDRGIPGPTFSTVVGIFHVSRNSAAVDWRNTETAS